MINILKAIFKTGSASSINIILGVINIKLIAILLGPTGVGLYSLIRQILQAAAMLGTFGGQSAIIQGIAKKTGEERHNYIKTIFWIFLASSSIVAISCIVLAPWIANTIFNSNNQQTIIMTQLLSIPAILMIFSIYFAGIINGHKAIGRLAIGQVLATIMVTILIYPISPIIAQGHPEGFIWMISISILTGLLFYIFIAYSERWVNSLIRTPLFNKEASQYFYNIASTMIITTATTALILLAIKALIGKYYDFATIGIFDAAWTLSVTYILILFSSLQSYYMPTLSQITNSDVRILFMQQMMRITILLVVPIIMVLILFKSIIINLLYSHEFQPAVDIFRWMLIGDYFKATSFVLGILVIAYNNMKIFFWTETLWNIGFFIIALIAIIFFKNIELIGLGFTLMYILNFFYYLHYAIKEYQFRITKLLLLSWGTGFFIIIITSILTWTQTKVNIVMILLLFMIVLYFLWTGITRKEKKKLSKFISSKLT